MIQFSADIFLLIACHAFAFFCFAVFHNWGTEKTFELFLKIVKKIEKKVSAESFIFDSINTNK